MTKEQVELVFGKGFHIDDLFEHLDSDGDGDVNAFYQVFIETPQRAQLSSPCRKYRSEINAKNSYEFRKLFRSQKFDVKIAGVEHSLILARVKATRIYYTMFMHKNILVYTDRFISDTESSFIYI